MRRLASLAGGAAVGQVLTVAASPILMRYYGPAELGVFSVFATTAMLLNSTNSVRYEMAIPVAESEESASHLVWLCFLLVTGFSVLLSGFVWGWGGAFCRVVKVPSLAPYLWLLPFTVAAAGAYEALNYYAVRRQDFTSLAQSRVVQSAVQVGIQLLAGIRGTGSVGLLVGDLAGRVLSAARLAWSGRLAGALKSFSWPGIKKAAVDYSRFPKIMAAATILNLAALQIPFLLIPVYFGPEAAGHYFLAYRTLFLPASFIGASISQVFLGEAAERVRDGEALNHITSRIFLVLTAAYLPIYTVCLAGAGLLFPVVFGARWGQAGHIAQVLAPMTLVWSLARPIGGMLLVRDRLKESLFFTVVELVGTVAAIYFGQRSGSIHKTALYVAIYGTLASIASIWRFLRAADVAFAPVLVKCFTLTALNLPLGLLVWAASRWTGAWGTLAASLAGTLAVGLVSVKYLRREGLL